jgi:hypothetical protein
LNVALTSVCPGKNTWIEHALLLLGRFEKCAMQERGSLWCTKWAKLGPARMRKHSASNQTGPRKASEVISIPRHLRPCTMWSRRSNIKDTRVRNHH